MSATNTQCPTDAVLSAFGLGKLDAGSAEIVTRHLEACADCRQRVVGISGDSFVGRLRQAEAVGKPSARERTYVPGESLANAANSTSGSLVRNVGQPPSVVGAIDDGRGRPSHVLDGLGSPSSVAAPPELANHPDYEIIKQLGQGGMGTVYLARNRMMDRMEVLKVISKALLDRPGALERFQQEIRSAAKLAHPNIVAAYSVLRPGDLLVFAMEYVKGQDLSQVVKGRGYLPVANAAFYIHQVALGLQHAHEKGMVHRDIKPNNLMLAIEGKKHVVKILDFGLAKASSEKGAESGLTKSGQMLGTPDYVAPEQTLDAHQADIRADIYSLGCTLYFLLSGGPPFQEASLFEILRAHHERDPRPLNLVRPEVPVELAVVVAKMMAKKPESRYQTPGEVAKALVPFFKPGQGIAMSPTDATQSRLAGDTAHGLAPATPISPITPPLVAVAQPMMAAIQPAATPTIVVAQEPSKSPKQPRPSWIAIAAGAAFIALLLGLIVIIRNRKGEEVARVEVPKGASLEIKPTEENSADRPDSANRAPPPKQGQAAPENSATETVSGPQKKGGRDETGTNTATAPPKLFPAFLVRGDWKIENDELVQPLLTLGYLIYDNPQIFPLISFGDESLSSYDLTLDVKKTGGKEVMGVFFHWLEPGHCQSFWLEQNRASNFSWFADGKWNSEGAQSKECKYESNRWYTLKVEVRANTYRVYVDNNLQGERTDDRFTHGRICLYTWRATARFRRIKLTDAHGNVLLEGLPQLPPASNDRSLRPNLGNTPRPLTAEEMAAKSEQEKYAVKRKLPVIATNSLGMKLALIPPGEFQIGELGRQDGNAPEHCVKITKPYYLGVYEVTQRECETVMKRNPSYFQNTGGESERATGVDTSQYPVDAATWYDAVEFCNKLSEKERQWPYYHIDDIQRDASGQIKKASVSIDGGEGYRLPTEAEWEYACRAGTRTRFNFGMGNNGTECNCNGTSPDGTHVKGPWLGQTIPIGSYRPNAFGLYDMHGNSGEWCWDAFDENYYRQSPLSDPGGPLMAGDRVYRGGIYCYVAFFSRSAHRMSLPADYLFPGFRVACGIGTAADALLSPDVGEQGNGSPSSGGGANEDLVSPIPTAANSTPASDGFVALFNGKDLSGWKTHPSQPGNWRVEKGAMIGSGPKISHLYSQRGDFTNFHLRVTARVGKDGDSGIYVRASYGPTWGFAKKSRLFPAGYAAQIYGVGPSKYKTGSLLAPHEWLVQRDRSVEAPNKWFTLEFIAEGNHLVVKVEGQQTADYTDDKRRHSKGHIALQQNAKTAVQFREIEIKELP